MRPVAAMTAEYEGSRSARVVVKPRIPVVTAHANQNQPSVPPHPSSTAPVNTLIIPVGTSITTTSNGQMYKNMRTTSFT